MSGPSNHRSGVGVTRGDRGRVRCQVSQHCSSPDISSRLQHVLCRQGGRWGKVVIKLDICVSSHLVYCLQHIWRDPVDWRRQRREEVRSRLIAGGLSFPLSWATARVLTSDNFQDLLARHPPEEPQILHLLHREAVLEKFGTINKNNGNCYPETVKKINKTHFCSLLSWRAWYFYTNKLKEILHFRKVFKLKDKSFISRWQNNIDPITAAKLAGGPAGGQDDQLLLRREGPGSPDPDVCRLPAQEDLLPAAGAQEPADAAAERVRAQAASAGEIRAWRGGGAANRY